MQVEKLNLFYIILSAKNIQHKMLQCYRLCFDHRRPFFSFFTNRSMYCLVHINTVLMCLMFFMICYPFSPVFTSIKFSVVEKIIVNCNGISPFKQRKFVLQCSFVRNKMNIDNPFCSY